MPGETGLSQLLLDYVLILRFEDRKRSQRHGPLGSQRATLV